MHIISSNRLDQLSAGLAENLAMSDLGVFEKDLVLVQSKAMAKWLKLEIASRNGLAAQVDFLYLKEFISKVLHQLTIKVNESFWSNETLTWRIFKLLPDFENKYSVLSDYVQDNLNRRHQLSLQIASLLDEYMIYRGEWLLSWEKGVPARLDFESSHHVWQMELWQSLCREDQHSFHHALHRFFQMDESFSSSLKLPKLISVFGITNMPSVFLTFLEKLSRGLDNHEILFYYLSPCFEYWVDFKPKSNYFKRPSQDALPEFSSMKEKVKPYLLLKSWGVLGRDFLNLLIEQTDFNTHEFQMENEQSHLLARVQNSILKLEGQISESFIQDDSIEIHACHHPMRELEVLKDYLKKIFKSDPLLKPHEVMVLCPDISKYSPYIKAVFESAHGDWSEYQQQIPFSISDQNMQNQSVLISGYLKLLNLSRIRLVNQSVVDLLQVKDIRESFGIEEDDLNLVYEWIKTSGIRWGRDAADRETCLGVKGFSQNSFEFGLERLMSGYAFDDEVMYAGHLSLPIGSEGMTLGKFKKFVRSLYQLQLEFSERKTPKEWIEFLYQLLDTFVAKTENNALERNFLLNAIQKLSSSWEASELKQDLSSDIVIHSLQLLLDEVDSSQGFLDGGVTFCTMLPMRSIPAKVVCLLGMNEGDFPRVDRRSGFDLMAKNWKQGDRSVRLNDRYIFLESLLSAQDYFYVSYCGFDAVDNTRVKPSILVSELIEMLSEGKHSFKVIHHPMHAYSPRYFNGEMKSFSWQHYEMAQALQGQKIPKKILCPEEFSNEFSDQEWKEIDVQDFVSFFKHPARYFLKQHLGTSFRQREVEELQADENFEKPEGLEKYKLKKEIHDKLRDCSRDKTSAFLRLKSHFLAKGQFPFGAKGELEVEEMLKEMMVYDESLRSDEGGLQEKRLSVKLDFEEVKIRLVGDLERVFDKRYVPYSYSRDSHAKRFYELIPFLILLEKSNVDEMRLHFSDRKLSISPLSKENVRGDLVILVGKYLEGMSRPLAFFPKSFSEYSKAIKGKDLDKERVKAQENVRKYWSNDHVVKGVSSEKEDEVYELCFGNVFPGDHPEFSETFWSTLEELSELLNRYPLSSY